MPTIPEPTAHRDFTRSLDRVLERRRWRRIAEVAVVVLTVGLVTVGAAIAWMAQSLFDPAAVAGARRLVIAVLVLLAVAAVVPFLRRMSRLDAARYAERADPGLDAIAVSAARVGPRVAAGSLEEVLVGQAARALAGSGRLRRLERPRLRRAAAVFAAALVVVAIGVGRAPLQHGLGLLLDPGRDPLESSPYTLTVRPGDADMVAGGDLAIEVTATGFTPGDVELVIAAEGADEARREAMTGTEARGVYGLLLLDVERPFEYFARSGAVTSPRYRVSVEPRAVVERIDVLYTFPHYTGRAPELVENAASIRAVRGTRAEIRAVPSRPVAGGELVLDGTRRIPLQAVQGQLRHTLELDRDGSYRVELTPGPGGQVAASGEYAIEAFADDRVRVALEAPGRDARVTAIEEIEIVFSVSDDVAVRDADLVLSVNGSTERVIGFAAETGNPGRVVGRHIVALEELGLEPGDMISYYARGDDSPGDLSRRITTDLYFLDVRPFENTYREAGGGAGGGGGGGGNAEAELTAQQRSLVVALFKLQRDRAGLDATVFRERVDTLREAQARIRDRVDAIVRRLSTRGFMVEHEGYRRMGEEMPRAARAMVDTEGKLALDELDPAVSDARRALLHLQRADAAFREVQVSARRGQAGGAGAQAELANLFQLEMDRFRNPYQDLQRGDRGAGRSTLDQALDKLRELSRRQQREVERARLRGAPAGATNPGRTSQQMLADEVEELARHLERLTRHRDRQQAEQAQAALERLRRARDAMQRAARSNDPGSADEALAELRALRRELQGQREGAMANAVDAAARSAGAALEEQRQIAREAAGLPDQSAAERPDALAERQRALADRVSALGDEVDRLQRRAERRDAELGRDLDAAARALRHRRVAERLRESARALSGAGEGDADAGDRQSELAQDIEAVREHLANAARRAASVSGSDDENSERLRDMVRQLKGDQQRLADAAGESVPAAAARGGGEPGAGSTAPTGFARGVEQISAVDFPALRQTMIERLRGLAPAADGFDSPGNLAQDISALVEALETIGDSPTARELQSLRALQAELFRRAQELELSLRESPAEDGAVTVARDASGMPPEWRELVDDYFRRLGAGSVSGDP